MPTKVPPTEVAPLDDSSMASLESSSSNESFEEKFKATTRRASAHRRHSSSSSDSSSESSTKHKIAQVPHPRRGFSGLSEEKEEVPTHSRHVQYQEQRGASPKMDTESMDAGDTKGSDKRPRDSNSPYN